MATIQGGPLITPVRLAASSTTLYTSTSCRTRIDQATTANPTAVDRLVTLYLVESGGAVGDPTTIAYQRTVFAGQTAIWDELVGHWLSDGWTIRGLCDSADKVNIMMSGVKFPK